MSGAPSVGYGEPSVELFAQLAAYQGITSLTEARLALSVASHADLRPELLALRAKPMPFLEPVPEPAQALTWLERGGDRP
ncbi:MAG: hypothetical protein IT196_09585 [Acidimicrobiales bacterium]|nr:hypothetical protein [Acidimicrobiales bacterium]